jgi:hypothetical protein
MSYFDKYLKYKNKYLALKDTVRGAEKKDIYDLGDEGFETLFTENITKPLSIKSVLFSKYPDIMLALNNYCWISPPKDDKVFDFGIGLFIFKRDVNKSFFDGFYDWGWKRLSNYAYWKIELHNIGPIIKLGDKSNNTETPFSTSIMLKSNQGENIPEGTRYGWNHDENCWIYNNNNKTFYKADLKLDFNWDDLSGFWNNNTIFPVNYSDLSDYFSDYCFVGHPTPEDYQEQHRNKAFGIGFFLYKIKKHGFDYKNYRSYSSNKSGDKYATFYITQDNIDNITLNNDITDKIYNDSGRKCKTTIPLLNIPVDTEYCWSHSLNLWIYKVGKQYYSAKFKTAPFKTT